jgi:hypothetical protein
MNAGMTSLMELMRILALVYFFATALYLAVRCMDVLLGFEDFEDSPWKEAAGIERKSNGSRLSGGLDRIFRRDDRLGHRLRAPAQVLTGKTP